MSKEIPDSAAVARWGAEVVRKARAMGLADESPDFPRLSLTTVREVADRVGRAGVAEHAVAALARTDASEHAALTEVLRSIDALLDEAPLPRSEWPRLVGVLGREELAGLLGISLSSAHRYERGERETPDSVAARLHWLALTVGDLAGAYNDVGIRRWFHRPRTLLEGGRPAELLSGDWDPDDPGPRRVRELARSLVGAGAT